MMNSARFWGFLIVLGAVVADSQVTAQSLSEIRARSRAIEEEVAEIREREFKRSINVEIQNETGLRAYLERQATLQRGSTLSFEDLDRYVRKLGLYRGEVVLDRSFFLDATGAGIAAYYDPDVDTFYLLTEDIPADALGNLLAHELCHGLQDQYFDLNEFFLDQVTTLNSDELLARQAVLEGEATYVALIWLLKNLRGRTPSLGVLQATIGSQLRLNVETLRTLMKDNASAQGDFRAAARVDSIPAFMILQPNKVYNFGMNLVHHFRKRGWEQVDRLFTDPPVSTEQILHPTKWSVGEEPDRLAWPAFENEDIFDGWELMHADTIGELMWRIIFSEFDMEIAGELAAEGWNGDRFAMFRSRDGQALLYLLYTTWDSDDDADEFEDWYGELLALKYPSDGTPYTVSRHGRDVLVLESDRDVDTDAILAFMRTVRTWELKAIGAVDFDGSGMVDFNDFLLFASNFGKDELASDYDPVYDLNQDGQINFPDFLEFVRHFGRSTS